MKTRSYFLLIIMFLILVGFTINIKKTFALGINIQETMVISNSGAGFYSVPTATTTLTSHFSFTWKNTYPATSTSLGSGSCTNCSTQEILEGYMPNGLETSLGGYGDGDYWFGVTNNGCVDINICPFEYISFTRSGGIWFTNNNIISSTGSRIEWINPPVTTPSATTTSRTINFQFRYLLNTSQDPLSQNNSIILNLCPLSYPNDLCQKVIVTSNTIPDTNTIISVTATTSRDGFYLGTVNFWNGVEENTECPWWNIFCEEETLIIGKGSANKFNVATTTIEADIPPGVQALFGQCADTGFFETAICNTLVFLFYPSEGALNSFEQTKNLYKNKLPFAFFYKISGDFRDLTNNPDGIAGEDVNVNIAVLGNETTTIFSWESAKTFFDEVIPENAISIISSVLWIAFCGFIIWLVLAII